MRVISKKAIEDAGIPVQPTIQFDVEQLVAAILNRITDLGTTGIEQAELWRDLANEGYKDDEINIAMLLVKYRNEVIYVS